MDWRYTRSGSPQWLRICSRLKSRSRRAAAHFSCPFTCSGPTGFPIVIIIGPSLRKPGTAAQNISRAANSYRDHGMARFGGCNKGPHVKRHRPAGRVNVPSGKNSSGLPSRATRLIRRASSIPFSCRISPRTEVKKPQKIIEQRIFSQFRPLATKLTSEGSTAAMIRDHIALVICDNDKGLIASGGSQVRSLKRNKAARASSRIIRAKGPSPRGTGQKKRANACH